MIRVETEGSFWLIDTDLERYCRMPKHEGPRPEDWFDDRGTAIEDLAWHAMLDWHLATTPVLFRMKDGSTAMYRPESYPLLVIRHADGFVTAPRAVIA